ncbi:MAG: hypothetical protein ACREV6_15630 [Clostridium sp.]|uniref:hypothetical protein n=1 Tax=Clostridium sp. TaxID=1506 RepID=UPI003D6C918C
MKKFKEGESNNEDLINKDKETNRAEESGEKSDDITKLKKLEEKSEIPDFINLHIKRFRMILGISFILCVVLYSITSSNGSTKNYKKDIKGGMISGVNSGDILSEDSVYIAKSGNYEVQMPSDNFGNVEISVWDFDKEDGDYVQVFVDGVAKTDPFMIRHRERKISVPSKAVIQIRGVRDGNGKGITYGVFFNKTGETYLNKAPLNSANIYTLKTAK